MEPVAVAVTVNEALVMLPDGVGWRLEPEGEVGDAAEEEEPQDGKRKEAASAAPPCTTCRREREGDGGRGLTMSDSLRLFIRVFLPLCIVDVSSGVKEYSYWCPSRLFLRRAGGFTVAGP